MLPGILSSVLQAHLEPLSSTAALTALLLLPLSQEWQRLSFQGSYTLGIYFLSCFSHTHSSPWTIPLASALSIFQNGGFIHSLHPPRPAQICHLLSLSAIPALLSVVHLQPELSIGPANSIREPPVPLPPLRAGLRSSPPMSLQHFPFLGTESPGSSLLVPIPTLSPHDFCLPPAHRPSRYLSPQP